MSFLEKPLSPGFIFSVLLVTLAIAGSYVYRPIAEAQKEERQRKADAKRDLEKAEMNLLLADAARKYGWKLGNLTSTRNEYYMTVNGTLRNESGANWDSAMFEFDAIGSDGKAADSTTFSIQNFENNSTREFEAMFTADAARKCDSFRVAFSGGREE